MLQVLLDAKVDGMGVGITQLAQCLQAVGPESDFRNTRKNVMAHACNLRDGDAEAAGSLRPAGYLVSSRPSE